MERFDVAKNRWEFVACMEERRYRPAVAAIGGKMFILGGEEGWDRYHGSIECYDPATGTRSGTTMQGWARDNCLASRQREHDNENTTT